MERWAGRRLAGCLAAHSFIHPFASPSTYPPFFPDTCRTYRGRSILLSIVLWIIEPQTTQPRQTWLSPRSSGLHLPVSHSPRPSPSFPFRPLSALGRGGAQAFTSPHLLTPTRTYQPPHTSSRDSSPPLPGRISTSLLQSLPQYSPLWAGDGKSKKRFHARIAVPPGPWLRTVQGPVAQRLQWHEQAMPVSTGKLKTEPGL